MSPGNLNEHLDAVLKLFQAQADKQQIDIVCYLDPNLPSVMLHSDSIQAALINLVKNAIEAMPEGGQLMVRTYAVPKGVCIDLIDTGVGMDDTTALKMFEPFFSTKHGGSGLGLPTARKIIEATVDASPFKANVGRGTKFILEFPTPVRLN